MFILARASWCIELRLSPSDFSSGSLVEEQHKVILFIGILSQCSDFGRLVLRHQNSPPCLPSRQASLSTGVVQPFHEQAISAGAAYSFTTDMCRLWHRYRFYFLYYRWQFVFFQSLAHRMLVPSIQRLSLLQRSNKLLQTPFVFVPRSALLILFVTCLWNCPILLST